MGKKILIASLSLLGSLGLAGCGSSSGGLPSCVEDHMKEKLTELDAITECLVDELAKNFATQSECEEFVSKNGGYEASRAQACKNYFEEKASADGGAGN
jgi:hypothetical protein